MKYEYRQYEVKRVLSGTDNHRMTLNQLVNSDVKKPTDGLGFGILTPEEKEVNNNKIVLLPL